MTTVAAPRRSPLKAGYIPAVLLALGAICVGAVGYELGFLGFAYQLMMPSRGWTSSPWRPSWV